MRAVVLACAVALALTTGAVAQTKETRIKNPDGTSVHVVTTRSYSTVTSFYADGSQDSKLRYPDYKGTEGHEAILLMLSPPGASFDRVR